ncbi:hypothetical protein VCUG_01336, partial [Vavraia culicis subsp. floridensis]
LRVIGGFVNLETLLLPKIIESETVIARIFSMNDEIGKKLTKLVYNRFIEKSEFVYLKRCSESVHQSLMWDDEVSINTYSSRQYKRYITTLRFEKDEHGPSSTQIILGEFLRECPHLECIVLVKEDWTIVLPNPDDSIDRKLKIKFIEMKINLPTIRQICESKLVNKIVLERVEITYTEPVETTISDIPKVSLESFICIGLSLQNKGFYDLLEQMQITKLRFTECTVDVELLDRIFNSEQMANLNELMFRKNALCNGSRFDISKLRSLTSINIICVACEPIHNEEMSQVCQFPVERNSSSNYLPELENSIYCTMLDLSLHVNLTSLMIDICPQNYSLFKKHVFRAGNLKLLTLHVTDVSIDISKILERNSSIEIMYVVGCKKSQVLVTHHKRVRSQCKELRLMAFIINNSDIFKYIAKLRQIEKLDISHSLLSVEHKKMVRAFYFRVSEVRLSIYVKYADKLIIALKKLNFDAKKNSVSFIVVN